MKLVNIQTVNTFPPPTRGTEKKNKKNTKKKKKNTKKKKAAPQATCTALYPGGVIVARAASLGEAGGRGV